MTIPEISNKNSNTLNELYHKRHYPEFYDMIIEIYKDYNISFREKLYWYSNNIKDYPICPICGNRVKFVSYGVGYKKYCSGACVSKDRNVRNKTEQTNIKRYGVKNPFQSEQLKEKSKKTNLERYGTEYANQSENVKKKIKQTQLQKYNGMGMGSDQTKDKIIQTQLQKYNGIGMSSDQIRDKIIHTNIERYGVENPMQFESIKEKSMQTQLQKYNGIGIGSEKIMEKIKQTNIERYGDERPIRIESIKEKAIQTQLQKYNGIGAGSEKIRNKMKQTIFEKYGVWSYSKTDEFKQKLKRANIKKMKDRLPELIDIIHDDELLQYKIKCPHIECDKCSDKFFIIPPMIYYNRKRQLSELCTNILPINPYRNSGTTIEIFIRDILDSLHISYITNDRSILDGKELDIYIPDYKLAIECNGVYWHRTGNESRIEKTYHFDKWNNCKGQGIQLLTIWEDQIINNTSIIENIIKSRLGIYDYHIGARKCILKEVPSKESDIFLKENHLQGSIKGSIRLGLYYNGELVSIMVFGHKRRALGNKDISDDIYELYRYCNKIGWQIIGGASRLFNHFIDSHPDCIIESFSSNDISTGNLYEKLNFKLDSIQKGSYWYIDKYMNRYHRYSYRKDMLVRNGADPSKTEFEITDEMGLIRIYDSGQQKWIYNQS